MGVERLLGSLGEGRRVLLDTSVVIYFLENSPVFGPAAKGLFRLIEAGRLHGHLSVVSALELLVKPFKTGNEKLLRDVELFLDHFPNLRLLDVTRAVAFKAAQVRAATGLKTPDAILVATAALYDCALVGNDHTWTRKHLGITYLYLADYLN